MISLVESTGGLRKTHREVGKRQARRNFEIGFGKSNKSIMCEYRQRRREVGMGEECVVGASTRRVFQARDYDLYSKSSGKPAPPKLCHRKIRFAFFKVTLRITVKNTLV